jgi:hypothetical protein
MSVSGDFNIFFSSSANGVMSFISVSAFLPPFYEAFRIATPGKELPFFLSLGAR